MSAPVLRPKIWIFFILSSVIWGFSFQMMKWGLESFSAFQLAAVRVISGGMIVLPFVYREVKKVHHTDIFWIILSALVSSLIPAYLFCFAETKVDGTTAGILNSFTPIWAFLIGIFLFRHPFTSRQFFGIMLGFLSVAMIIFSENQMKSTSVFHSLFIVIATFGYAVNVWIVSKKLAKVNAISISIIGLAFNVLPAAIIFLCTDYLSAIHHPAFLSSLGAGTFLGVVGTALVGYIFFLVIKGGGPVFASTVTFAIPVVGIVVGVFLGKEFITLWQVLGIVGILVGIYLSQIATKKQKTS